MQLLKADSDRGINFVGQYEDIDSRTCNELKQEVDAPAPVFARNGKVPVGLFTKLRENGAACRKCLFFKPSGRFPARKTC